MLDFIYYPVSAILWFWHQLFGTVLDSGSGISWALSVAFLVFTIRAVLVRPFLGQARAQRAMRRLAPELATLKRRYAGDRQGLAVATAALHKKHGVNPFVAVLPALVQAPVILGLYHVLKSFNRTVAPLWMTVQQNAQTANYLFSPSDVQSFLGAKLFGAPLAASISWVPTQLAGDADVTRADIALVAIPMMIIAAVATHFTARASIARARQFPMDAPPSSARIMNAVMLWVFPLGVLVGGAFLPVAILVYWLSNNAWTLAQQQVFHRILDREDAAAVSKAAAAGTADPRRPRGPRPGSRPNRGKRRNGPPGGAGQRAA